MFTPKYRRQIIYREQKPDIGNILKMLCEQKKVTIIEAGYFPSYTHMLVDIPPHLSVASFVGYLKSKSARMIFDKRANPKYKYGNRHFWARGNRVDTVKKYEGVIAENISNQLQKNVMNDQLSLKEIVDPFTGEKSK